MVHQHHQSYLVTLCYLPKDTTPFFCNHFTRMFKARYRRRFATCLVEQFDRTGEAPLDINILQSIRLISVAWDDIPPHVFFHCWLRAGVIASQNRESFPSYEAYTQYLRDSTSMSITLLLTASTNSQQVNTLAEEFLTIMRIKLISIYLRRLLILKRSKKYREMRKIRRA